MKTLQIWISKDSARVKSYMKSVIKYTPNYEHYFIGPKEASVKGQIILDPESELKKAYDALGNKEWWDKYLTANMFKADMLRLHWALENNDLIYADADVEFLYEPILPKEKNIPVMGIKKNGKERGLQEFFLFYTNDCSDWFQQLINYTLSEPVINFSFMRTFIDIRNGRFWDINKPLLWDVNTFYKRHK